ncbi:hypothetical protein FGIG_04809 [Fasciola gigantica]|uniref:Uncharacterized protein n=1 Tax=Fasciola gigantica TaxID=46835 RepID=A0A504ZBC8_FASGI|nr:hypothetical protein FGIG_04809 [Fasciola gigantica]
MTFALSAHNPNHTALPTGNDDNGDLKPSSPIPKHHSIVELIDRWRGEPGGHMLVCP